MKIAIVDDMPDEAAKLAGYIDKWCIDNSIPHECDMYPDGSIFIDNALNGEYDLIFLDIYMTVLNGIETARVIRNSNNKCNIIFLTSSQEHMHDAFSVHAYDYIIKPADKCKVSKVLNDLYRLQTVSDRYLEIYYDKHDYKIAYGDIISVEADSNYCIVTSDIQYRTRISFGHIQKELSSDRHFLTINRGLIINMDYVHNMDNGICTFKNGCIFPLNSRKAHELKQAFIDYNFMLRHERNTSGGLL